MEWKGFISGAARFVAESAAETLWPTRCAICESPGEVLCRRCRAALPYLDWWRACRRCGSPYGLVQCDLCNSAGLGRLGVDELPFKACASAMLFTAETGQIVRVFKDQGEQRLAATLAQTMANVLPSSWDVDVVTFVPATLGAVRNRGYDHAELLALELASRLGLPCEVLLGRPQTRDQRRLGARERIANLAGSFGSGSAAARSRSVLLVDDVFTTGATLCAASAALAASGAREVCCLTFARV